MPVLQLTGMRQLIGGSLYVLYFLGKGRVFPRGKEWWPILVLSFFNFLLSNTLSTWGVKYITAGMGAIIGAIVPIWIVLITGLQKGSVPKRAVLGVILGFGGICLVFFEHLIDFMNPSFSYGIIISVFASLTWAIGSLYTKKQAVHFNPYFSIGLQMMISGAIMYSLLLVSGQAMPMAQIPWQGWMSVGYLVVFGSVVAFIAYLYALQHLPTEQASIYAYINPIVALLFGSLLFDEHLTIFIVLGGILTLLGVYLVNNSYRLKK
jgi:hypothetical protein